MRSGKIYCWACTLLAGALLWLLWPQMAGAADVQDLLSQASAAMQRGEFKMAEKQYRTVLREAPDESQAQMGLATVLVAQGRRPEARAILEALLGREPGFQPAYYLLGLIFEGEGDLVRAKAAYQAYVARNPAMVSTDPQVRIKLRQLGVF